MLSAPPTTTSRESLERTRVRELGTMGWEWGNLVKKFNKTFKINVFLYTVLRGNKGHKFYPKITNCPLLVRTDPYWLLIIRPSTKPPSDLTTISFWVNLNIVRPYSQLFGHKKLLNLINNKFRGSKMWGLKANQIWKIVKSEKSDLFRIKNHFRGWKKRNLIASHLLELIISPLNFVRLKKIS